MSTKTMRKGIIALGAAALIAVGTAAVAGQGKGYGDGDRGYGRHHRHGDCPYGQRFANLTDEQREQMESERQAFFEATRQNRQDLYAKRLELRAVMAQRTPDKQKAAALQKEVSDLQATLDQQRLEHIMAMRQIDPDAGRGFLMDDRGMGRHGMGSGMGHGRGMGYGPGPCRD